MQVTDYFSWVSKATALLEGKPEWTAIKDDQFLGYFVLMDGTLFCAPDNGPDYIYTEDDLSSCDPWQWSGDAWEGMTAQQCNHIIENPVFVELRHE